MCFWEVLQCATKCEKDGKVYAVRVSSERGFEHLTECEDIIISRNAFFALVTAVLHCSHHSCLPFDVTTIKLLALLQHWER